MEKYSVLITTSGVKELESVDGKADRARIIKAIRALAENPRGTGSEKLSGSSARFRVRVGDYRVVYSVDDERRTVDIVKIGHRREVYR